MSSSTPRFARSILFVALMAMIGQAIAVCCVGQQLPVSTHDMALMADEPVDCHSQSTEAYSEASDHMSPSSGYDCDMEGKACCTQATTALDVDNFKFRNQLNNDIQFDSDVFHLKDSIDPPQTAILNWRLLSEHRKPHQTTPYYISYCSFLE